MPRLRIPRLLALAALLLPLARADAQQARQYRVLSPDGATELAVELGDRVTYSVTRRGVPVITASPISLTVDAARTIGVGGTVRSESRRQVRDSLRPVAPVKRAVVPDRFNELRLRFGDHDLELRAYDEGVAYRWVLAVGDSVTVRAEQATFGLAGPAEAIVGVDTTFFTHYEPVYRRIRLDTLRDGRHALLPALVALQGGRKVAITESQLEDYPGMYLVARDGGGLTGTFPRAALEERARNDRDVPVTRRADYLARTSGRRALPWRIVMIADDDRQLLTNQMVYALAAPSRLSDVSWIRPGKVAWDWYNNLNLRGVGFRAGVNNETYRYFIDFASKHGIPYIVLDEGWYKLGDLLTQSPGIDVAALVQYGASKNVGIILWTTWSTLDTQMTPALDQFARWGVKGIKVDFMQRDDQKVVNYYYRIAREAAARRLLVDYHGAHKPAGLDRTWPNVLTFEGVHGLENNKWTDDVTPTHNVTLPFTRMLAGPMDYTPGAMINAQPRNFRAIFDRPMSIGTRVHQLAMYVVFESPLQMLADSPSEYEREPEAMEWLRAVPVLWDDTRVLDAAVGSHVLMARRRGAEWFVGAMTNNSARSLTLDLAFLGAGRYTMDAWSDGINADRNATDFRKETRTVSATDKLTLQLAPGGGFVARVRVTQ
ncbi:MAG TPA: glycoside hydrolase family 97 protein [Gemmatimonadaceae bacterium]|nr:glycoside hydrolase family 97 protein [Gemmatimonadaceae bacterium]